MDNSLYSILKHLHAIMRWILLITLLISLFYSLYGITRKSKLPEKGLFAARLTLIFAHLQLIAGLILYLISPKVVFDVTSMQSPILRFFLVEHVLGMIIAITLITTGYIRMKRKIDSSASSRNIFWYYLTALIFLLLLIPWPFLNYGGSWI